MRLVEALGRHRVREPFRCDQFRTEDEAELARDHAATRCPQFTDGRPIDWQVFELPPRQPRRDEEAE